MGRCAEAEAQLDKACRVLTAILEATERQPPEFPEPARARIRALMRPVLC